MAKMWAGRTDGITDRIADDFNSSIHFDSRMYRQDITGSMAHAAMLAARNIITAEEADTLIAGLEGVLADIESGALPIDMTCEDIHMFVEQVLTERLGDVGKKLHTARSRNDQVALDIRMYLRDEITEIISLVRDLIEALTDQAEANAATIMPGYIFERFLWSVDNGVYTKVPEREAFSAIAPATVPEVVTDKSSAKDVLILTDLTDTDSNLAAMISRFRAVLPYDTRVVNISGPRILPEMASFLSNL